MQILGHGIDIESIRRVKQNIDADGDDWIAGFCSEAEQAAADPPPVHYRYYAGRYVAKEAVVKALGTGFAGKITWHGIEILRSKSGAPSVKLREEVKAYADKLGIVQWAISISYCGDIAMASVIAVGE